MRKVSFTFKRFDITDVHCGHKVGTDGVVLGAWADCRGATHVIDVGCGSGLIALMIAQRSEAHVTALEINEGAVADAVANVAASPWNGRIEVVGCDFIDYKPSQKVNLIVSNPPFFHESLHSPDVNRANARHEGGLSYRTLIDYASRHLASDGILSFIYASGRSSDIIYCAEMKHLKLRRHCLLRQSTGTEIIRELYEFSPTDGDIVYEDIAIRGEDNEFTPRFKELTKEFYL